MLAAGWGPRCPRLDRPRVPSLQTCARGEAAHASSPSRRTKSTMTSLCVVPAAVASARRAATPGASGAPARALCAARARAPNAKVRAGPPETSPFFQHDRVRRRLSHLDAHPPRVQPPPSPLARVAPRRPRARPSPPRPPTDKNIRSNSNPNPNPTRRVPNPDPDPPPLALAPIPSLSSARASPSPRVPAAPSRPARPPATATRSSPSSSPPFASLARSPPSTTTKTPTTRSTSTATSPSRRRSSRRASRRPSARTTSSARRWRS